MRRRNIPHRKISIHALCEEGDSFSFSNRPVFSSFLSTPSARRATDVRAGLFCSYGRFLSTPSARRATPKWLHLAAHAKISIHALCEEGDGLHPLDLAPQADFYPRPLRGGRRAISAAVAYVDDISIHALCEEGDFSHIPLFELDSDFYPRPLRGGRPMRRASAAGLNYFYPRPLRGGRHRRSRQRKSPTKNFYPRPLRGGRQQKQRQNLYFQTNYTTFCTNLEEL